MKIMDVSLHGVEAVTHNKLSSWISSFVVEKKGKTSPLIQPSIDRIVQGLSLFSINFIYK